MSRFNKGQEESKASGPLRLANSFRRASNPSCMEDDQDFEKSRSEGHESIEAMRKRNIVRLPLSLIRSKSRTMAEIHEDIEQAPSQNNLGDLFFAAPNEIQVEILGHLSTSDMLSLRMTSKSLSELLQLNASPILGVVLQNSSLGDESIIMERLYPPPKPIETFDYFLQMMHREKVVLKMISIISDFVQLKIYQARSSNRRKQFAPSRARMEKRLKVSTFIIYHFLERLREKLRRISEGDCDDEDADCRSEVAGPVNVGSNLQASIIKSYPADLVLAAFQFYRVLVSAYRQKLRPPTYAGTIERKLRGWYRTPPGDGDVAHVLIYGGMEEVLKIMSKPTYSARITALSTAVLRINGRPLPAGSRWMVGSRNPQFIRDLDITPIANVNFIEAGSDVRLTVLYSPWIRELLAQDAPTESDSASTPSSRPLIPSPFSYIEELLKDQDTGAIAGGAISADIFSARAAAADEDEDHAHEAGADDAPNPGHGVTPHHPPSSFPTQYG